MIFYVSRREDNLLDISTYINEFAHSPRLTHIGIEEKDLDETVFLEPHSNYTQILIPFDDWLLEGKPEKLTRTITCH